MLYDFLILDYSNTKPLYLQLYDCIKNAIEQSYLKEGQKLPSIRKLSQDIHLSRTTIEAAYQQLCVEGYVKSYPQRGYYVMAAARKNKALYSKPLVKTAGKKAEKKVRYNLSSDYVDSSCVDSKLWTRHVKDVLGRQEVIVSYGNPQGEQELREALSLYSHGTRGVVAAPDSIVVGAGTQPLLYLLCGLLAQRGRTVAMEKPGFRQAEQVFLDCGFKVIKPESDENGVKVDLLERSGAKVLFVSPSGMPMNRRFRLLEWAEKTGGLLIEDDYNGELRYNARPISSLQGQSEGKNVVYIGSFSKLLLPSVRIGYMALPDDLLASYQLRARRYNQTASKIEQLALARYITEGQLERQLRRLRKLYAAKSALLTECLRNSFGSSVKITLQETALCLLLTVKNGMGAEELVNRARQQEVKLMLPEVLRAGESCVRMSFAGIPTEEIAPAVRCLEKAWK